METEGIRRQLAEVAEKEKILTGDLEHTRRESDTLKEEYDRLEAALAQEDALMAGNRDELNRCTVENSSLEGRIGVLNEQIRTEEMNEAHIGSRREAISRDLESRKTQLAGYEEQKAQMDVQADAMAGRLDESAHLLESRDELIHRLEQEIESENRPS